MKKRKSKNHFLNYSLAFLWVCVLLTFIFLSLSSKAKATNLKSMISPEHTGMVIVWVRTTPTPTMSSDFGQKSSVGVTKTSIEKEIERVFGKHAPRAKKIVRCESNFKATAVGVNKDGSKDVGYWQINQFYHPHITWECATDAKCSTSYAYRMFKNDNFTFRRWACNRKI